MALLARIRPRERALRRLAVLALVLLGQIGAARTCLAGDGVRMMEQSIKAGLLYNFLKYTEWPADRSAPASPAAVVCIFGDDPFHGSLQPMTERSVNQRRIVLRVVHDVEGTEQCELLFVNADEKQRWPQLSAFLAGKGVLTVSDFADFADSGGMVEFGEKNDRIDVRINMKAVRAARLVVHERLLKLARVVDADER